MRLDAARDDDVIALERVAIEVDRDSLRRSVDDDCLHRGTNFRPRVFLGDPVRLEDLALSLRRAATMTPHGRNDHRLGTELADMVTNRLGNLGDIRDTAAAGGDSARLPSPDFFAEIELLELTRDFPRHVRKPIRVKGLPNSHHSRKCHAGTPEASETLIFSLEGTVRCVHRNHATRNEAWGLKKSAGCRRLAGLLKIAETPPPSAR